ncbi:hypothetical protein D9M69_709930 [compost metagenome]
MANDDVGMAGCLTGEPIAAVDCDAQCCSFKHQCITSTLPNDHGVIHAKAADEVELSWTLIHQGQTHQLRRIG